MIASQYCCKGVAMTSRIPVRSLVPGRRTLHSLGLLPPLCLALVCVAEENAGGTPGPPALSAEQQLRLKERDRLEKEAKKLGSEGRLESAIRVLEEKVAIERQILGETSDAVAGSLELIESFQEQRNDWNAAIATRREILSLREKKFGSENWRTVDARTELAITEQLAKMGAEDRARIAEAEKLDREGVSLIGSGRLRDSVPTLEKALSIRRALQGDRHAATIATMGNLSIALRLQGEYRNSRPLAERAVALTLEVFGERHPMTISIMGNLASLLRAIGEYGAARPLAEKVLQLIREAKGEKDPDSITALNNLAMLMVSQQDYAAARPLAQRVLELRRQVQGDRHPETIRAQSNLAGMLRALGDASAARPLAEEAVFRLGEVQGERHYFTIEAMSHLAALYQMQGDYRAARPLSEKTVALFREVHGPKHPNTLGAMNNLADLLGQQKELETARSMYEQVLAVRKEVYGDRHPDTLTAMNRLATVLRDQGDIQAARQLVEKELTLRREVEGEQHPDTTRAMSYLAALLHDLGQDDQAIPMSDRAAREAELSLGRVLPSLPERERMVLLQKLRSQLDLVLDLCSVGGSDPAGIYAHVLAVKGLASDAASARRARAIASPALREQVANISTLRSRLGRAYAQRVPESEMSDHSRQLRQLVDDIATEEMEAARAIGWHPDTPRPGELLESLPEDTLLVDIIRYEHEPPHPPRTQRLPTELRYLAFVTRKNKGVSLIQLGDGRTLDQALAEFRASLEQDRDSAGFELAERLWKPLETHLRGIKIVLLAPDGDLNFVPWAGLPDPMAPGHYLVERYALATIGSGRQLLAELRRAPSNVMPTLLAAGAVDYDRGDFGVPSTDPASSAKTPATLVASRGSRAPASTGHYGSLHSTGSEIHAVGDRFERTLKGKVEILEGSRATKDTICQALPGHRYLHLATHGYFAPPSIKSAASTDPTTLTLETAGRLGRADIEGFYPGLLSGLAWAGVNHPPVDPVTGLADLGAGTMTAEEVSAIDLSACELAVLSACETGLGRTAGGEGVLGLQRAFHQAGCKTVIASLWKVDDAATAALMTRFYEHLWGEKRTPIEAMRLAQIEMLEGRLPLGGSSRGISASGAGRSEVVARRQEAGPSSLLGRVVGQWGAADRPHKRTLNSVAHCQAASPKAVQTTPTAPARRLR